MTPRAPAVRRWLRRPLWWLLGLTVLGLLFAAEGICTYWTERSIESGSVPAEAVIVASWDGGQRVPVDVSPPGGGDRVRTTVWAKADSALAIGPVAVRVDPDDPSRARLDRPVDAWPLMEPLTFFGPLLAAVGIWWALRVRRQRQSERLAADPAPAFRMMAAPVPGRFARTRWRLHLYPLDASPGAAPVCSVPVIGTEQDLRPRIVDVKGEPRPGGQVVAMEPETGWVWWPSSRALITGREPLPPLADLPVAPSYSPWRWALVVVGAILLFVGLESGEDAEVLNERSEAVTVEVTEGHGAEVADTPVRYRWEGEDRTATIRLMGPQFRGDEHELRIDPAHPTHLWQPGTEETLPGQDADWSGLAMTVGTVLLIFGIIGAGRPEGRTDEHQPLR